VFHVTNSGKDSVTDNREAYDGCRLVADVEFEACVEDDSADMVDGEDADELREDDLEACSLDMLGRVGLALSTCAS
jgi:hypothetical protein